MIYHVIIFNDKDEFLADEEVHTPAEVNRILNSMLGVRIESWTKLSINIYKREV